MWGLVFGSIACIAVAGWLVFVAPTRRLVRHLRADDLGIAVGRSDVIPWSDICEIGVETTGRGPWLDDFYLVLVANGRRPVRIPEALAPVVLPALQRLPAFDNEALLRATGSAERAYFVCWKESGTPS